MEDDVDIYSDLPSFNLNPDKNDQVCNCKELKKELSLLISKLGNIERIKTNLENNLFSLLKTARAEITRKDKMIDDLRKRLDDITFRRSRNSGSLGFSTHRLSHQHTVTRKYENVPSIHSQETEIESYQIQFYHDEYKNRKSQNDVNRIPTVFGERLHKRIIEDEKEEKKQKALLKLSAETKDISKENIIENNKENGFQFSINNKDNESNIGRCSNSEPPCRKNLVKRRTEEDDTHRHKRIKIENNENKTMTEETDYNYLTRCDLTENPTQYEMKDNLIKFEDRLDAAHSFKKEEISFCAERRAASEYRDIKQDQDYTNGWKSETRKNNLAKDRDSSNTRNGLADSSRNSRTASTSHRERFSDYKKNEYRYSSPRRSYSRSRSDYESSSNHRLRERSNRSYREKKYDDYKYDSRHKNDKLKRNYEREKNDRKTRYRRRERGDLRDKSRYSSSDADDKESNSSYKNKKYESRKIKKETAIVLNDKKLHENNKAAAETNLRKSSSRTIVNSIMNYSTGKNIEQLKVKNESEIKSINMTENTFAHVVKKDLDIPEEGEILDSSENKNNSAKISEDNEMEENNVKIVLVEDKNEDISMNASIDDKSIPLQNNTNSTKQLEMVNISAKKIEVASYLQENSKDYGKIIQLNSSKSDMAVDEAHNCIKDEDKCKSHINEMEYLMDSTTQNIGIIEPMRDNNINDNKNDEKRSKDSVETVIKIKETTGFNIESVTKIKELDESSIESVTKKEKISNPDIESVVEIMEVNNFNNDNSIHKIDTESRTSIAEVTKVEAVLNCNIEDKDKSQALIENETFHQMSNKSDVKMCLNDHNYVQNPIISPINISDLDAIQKSSLRSKCETVLETAKETKAEKAINIQSVDVKKTMSTVKNKKVQQSKGILISHRRKAVILSDSNASMTVLMNTNIEKTSSVINNCNDSTLKPRACKISRVTIKATCK